jgi:hypothetical protein
MGFVERINQLTGGSGLSGTLDVIGRPCWKIALSITKGVKIVRSLGISKEFQHQL